MHSSGSRWLVVFLLASFGFPLVAQQEDPVSAAALAKRREALHAAGVTAPLVLHPVALLGQPSAKVAEVLGLVLEGRGMADLEVAAGPFAVAKELAWDDVPARFGAHVKKAAAAKPRYHLYAEFLGTPRTGPEEVRFVVVDGDGELVWSDRQTKADADFRRTAAKDPDPLGCAGLVAERLFSLAAWRKAPGVKNGKFATLWRDKSGVPDEKELQAMAQRTTALRAAAKQSRFVVLPTLAMGKHDQDSSARVAALLQKDVGGTAAAGAGSIQLATSQDSNEQKRLWDLAHGLRAAVSKAPVDADYVVVVDLGLDPTGARGFVHIVVGTGKGELAVVAFVNDQHPLFQEIAPKTVEDAERLAVALLQERLKQGR